MKKEKILKYGNFSVYLSYTKAFKYFAIWYKKRRLLIIDCSIGLTIGFFDKKI